MNKYLLPIFAILLLAVGANAQTDSTRVIDNKGTIKYVLKANNPNIITRKDSLILYVTPKQLGDSLNNYVQYSDTMTMLMNYLNDANNGLNRVGQTVKLGGALTQATTITTGAFDLILNQSVPAGGKVKVTGLQSGSTATDSVMVVSMDGTLKWVSASTLFNALTFSNGLTKTGNLVELGGALTKATTITTTGVNSLAIAGLQSGSKTDSIVVADPTTGVLKRISASSLNNTMTYSINSGLPSAGTQVAYTITQAASGVPASYGTEQVWVFRNGAKLVAGVDYTVVAGAVTITPQTTVPNEDWAWGAYERIELQWVE